MKSYYFNKEKLLAKKSLTASKQTRTNNQQAVVKLLGFTSDKANIISKLTSHLQQHIKLNGDPTYLFHTALHYCEQEKCRLLGYTTLQDLIGQIIHQEERRLTDRLQSHLPPDTNRLLQLMLEKR